MKLDHALLSDGTVSPFNNQAFGGRQTRTSVASTMYSSDNISRTNLKFRLRRHKRNQFENFRNTMKDLQRFIDPSEIDFDQER